MGTPIKTYICQVKCFHKNRIWNVGESLQVVSGEAVPKHFVPKESYKPDPMSKPPEDPKTFAEWQRKEQAEALRAVGHGIPAPKVTAAQAPVSGAEKTGGPVNAEGQGASSDPNEAFQ